MVKTYPSKRLREMGIASRILSDTCIKRKEVICVKNTESKNINVDIFVHIFSISNCFNKIIDMI